MHRYETNQFQIIFSKPIGFNIVRTACADGRRRTAAESSNTPKPQRTAWRTANPEHKNA
jgi:hypothetical protein